MGAFLMQLSGRILLRNLGINNETLDIIHPMESTNYATF